MVLGLLTDLGLLLEAGDLYPQLTQRTDGSSTIPLSLPTACATSWVSLFEDGEDEVCSRSIPVEFAHKHD